MKKLLVLLNTFALFLWGCSDSDSPMAEETKIPVHFALEEVATRAASSNLAMDSTVRVLAYRVVVGQTGLPLSALADECTYRVTAAGLVPCAVNTSGTYDAASATPRGIELAPGMSYSFYAITPAFRVFHEADNPSVGVKHRTDFAVSLTTPVSVTAGANTVTLDAFARKCASVSFRTDRAGVWTGIETMTVDHLTMEMMSDEPMYVSGNGSLALPSPGNTYTTPVTLDGSLFKTGAATGDKPYNLTAEANLLPREKRDFRLKVVVRYNDNTIPTILETTVPDVELAAGSKTKFNVIFEHGAMNVVSDTDSWVDMDKGQDNFGKE